MFVVLSIIEKIVEAHKLVFTKGITKRIEVQLPKAGCASTDTTVRDFFHSWQNSRA